MTDWEKVISYLAHVEKLNAVAKKISRSFEGVHASSELPKLIAILKDALAENRQLRAQLAALLLEGTMAVTTEFLFQDRDFTLIVDNSGSMKDQVNTGCKTGSRWKNAYEAVFDIARMSHYDSGVLSLYLFADKFKRWNAIKPEAIEKIWVENPPGTGGTNLSGVLKDAIDNYFARKTDGTTKKNGEFIAVMTDGIPNDKDLVAKTISDATQKMDKDEELSIFFLQVGQDPKATEFLKRLDDDLKAAGAKFDIVDHRTADEIGDRPLLGVLMQAVND